MKLHDVPLGLNLHLKTIPRFFLAFSKHQFQSLGSTSPQDFIITGRYFRLLQPELVQCVWLYAA
jgi:hypothetical protein